VTSVVLAGCGDKTTTVTGKVSLDGQPVEAGFVILYGPTGACVSTGIIDGTYEVHNPPRGNVTVVVSDGAEPPRPGATATRQQQRPGSIPPRYQSKQTSPLKLELKEGPNSFDVELVSVQPK
jgi:hypothetical protein